MIHVYRSTSRGFTQVSNEICRNPDLSLRARGLLVQLLSHEDGWQQSITYCTRECRDSRDSVASALRELEAAGYIRRTRRRGTGGKWLWDHEVADAPIYGVSPSTASPSTVGPSTVKASIEEESLGEEPLDVEPQDLTLALASRTHQRDEVFEALCAIEGHGWADLNTTERSKLNKARKLAAESGAIPQDITFAASRWPDVMGDATLTALGVMSNYQRLLTGPPRARRQAAELPLDRMARELMKGRSDGQPRSTRSGTQPIVELSRSADE